MERREDHGRATHAERPVIPTSRRSTWRAIDAPPTRRHVRRLTLIVVALCAAVAACVVATTLSWRSDTDGPAHPVARPDVVGRVESVSTRAGGRGAPPRSEVVVTYPVAGTMHRATVVLAGEPPEVRPGETVPLLVDRDDPGNVDVVGAAPPRALGARTVGLTAAAAALVCVTGWRALVLADRRRLLVRNPWVVMQARVVELPLRRHPGGPGRRFVLLDDPTSESVTARSAQARSLPRELAPTAWVAGWGDRFLVAVPGGAHVLAVRKVPARRSG